MITIQKYIVNKSQDQKIKNLLIMHTKYPDFKFICPNCGSLEVIITWKRDELPLEGHCLDCNENWTEVIKQLQAREIDRIWSVA